jgi:hypothetical protein
LEKPAETHAKITCALNLQKLRSVLWGPCTFFVAINSSSVGHIDFLDVKSEISMRALCCLRSWSAFTGTDQIADHVRRMLKRPRSPLTKWNAIFSASIDIERGMVDFHQRVVTQSRCRPDVMKCRCALHQSGGVVQRANKSLMSHRVLVDVTRSNPTLSAAGDIDRVHQRERRQ